MWWPELTVDVVQGDLQQLAKGRSEKPLTSKVPSESMGPEMDGEESEWRIKTDNVVVPPTTSGRFKGISAKLSLMKRKINEFRYNMSMTALHASMMAANSEISPLDFCDGVSADIDIQSLPSKALSVEEYVKRFSEMGTVCVSVTTHCLSHMQSFESPTQDMKDIQRDSVVVNGKIFRGAESGYQRIVNEIAKGITDPLIDAEEIARKSLSVANRTFSGGIAFDHVIRTLQPEKDDLVVIVPVSAEAEPLDIAVVENRNQILVRAHTKYRIEDHNTGGPIGTVNACLLAEVRAERIQTSRAFVFLSR
jgi:hypothetical protein